MVIHVDHLIITKDNVPTQEFKAVLKYRDLEALAKELLLAKLVETGQVQATDSFRIESRLCEPDGDMGYPGIRLTLMFGPANYYPRLMELPEERDVISSLAPSDVNRPGLFRRLMEMFK